MAYLSDHAIVIRRLDYSETSQILTVFTHKHGKQSLIARGIKRSTKSRYAPEIDLLEEGHVIWSDRPDRQRTLSPLTEWKQTRAFTGLRENLTSYYGALYAVDITTELTVEADPHSELFECLLQLLEQLQESCNALPAICTYQAALLREVGYLPQANRCAVCQESLAEDPELPLYFSSHEGGFLCRNCEPSRVEKRRVSFELWSAFKNVGVPSGEWAGLFDLLNYHLSHIMSKESKLADMIVPAAARRSSRPPSHG